ncbi:MAG TPA: DUF294 nucleotidyltransferase-like domain-containing protein [Saprospiraceae bacterium]|nr:DUF294 nucleotidyltransferase-like domain-containing protein [Saprospiraceae bacterium]HMP26142.1 DUF294 nucleotidyltransferase-like domain-containing protein [Saprospiraceae bacterium]
MENTIAARIHDFLKGYPPFHLLSPSELSLLAARAVVRYCSPDTTIFRQGEALHEHAYVVREGAIQLYSGEYDEAFVLLEKCDEGDLFGIQPLLTDQPYLLSALATEESLLYGLRVDSLRQLSTQHPQLAFYLANSYASGYLPQLPNAQRPSNPIEEPLLVEIQPLEQRRSPVICTAQHSIREAADIMSQEEVSSIIVVNAQQHPIGIITDKDLRRRVATGRTPLHVPVTDIMSKPVITIPAQVTVADVQIQMVKHRIHHLCVTEDGTDQTPVTSVISEHDLLVIQANNPAVLIRNARRSRSAADLRRIREKSEHLLEKYIRQEVSIAYISTVITEINDAMVRRILQLSEAALTQVGILPPGVPFCWLALGSAGREEQLLRTDQDHALVFADVPPEQYAAVKDYYLQLAAKAATMLHECGFDYCPADMMASNPQWCLSLSDWKAQFSDWIRTPTQQAVLYCTIFFDYRAVYGELSLAEALTAHVFSELDVQSIFLPFLAKNALQNPPPLTFFRDFMVERSGEHKDAFDIKTRAMMPLCDAARVLVLNARFGKINNTFRRFEKLAELEPQNRELYQQAADAYELLMRYRALQGLQNRNSGRFFKPAQLSKTERLLLRNSFRPVRELQSLLNVRFQLAYIRN